MSRTDKSDEEIEARVWELIRSVRVGMLTLMQDGMLASRPMSALTGLDDGLFYFLARNDSDAVQVLRDDNRVNVSFADQKNNDYLSISGTASVSHDAAKIKQLWNMFAQAWFPVGPDDPVIALIEVRPHKAGYWRGESNSMVEVLKTAKAVITCTQPDIGESAKITM